MNVYELIHLAADASGGGVSYDVTFRHSPMMRGVTDVSVARFDTVAHRYTIYGDKSHQLMKDTDMRDDYRPLAECIKIMKDDAEKLSTGYVQVNASEYGVATRKKVIEYVREYRSRNGQSPTQKEIADGIGRVRGSNFTALLRDMRSSGLIHFNDNLARTVAINEKGVREWQESLK